MTMEANQFNLQALGNSIIGKFVSIISSCLLLDNFVGQNNAITIFLPKFHPELNPIERFGRRVSGIPANTI